MCYPSIYYFFTVITSSPITLPPYVQTSSISLDIIRDSIFFGGADSQLSVTLYNCSLSDLRNPSNSHQVRYNTFSTILSLAILQKLTHKTALICPILPRGWSRACVLFHELTILQVVNITDNDLPPIVSLHAPASIIENSDSPIPLRLDLVGTSAIPVQVNFSTSSGENRFNLISN